MPGSVKCCFSLCTHDLSALSRFLYPIVSLFSLDCPLFSWLVPVEVQAHLSLARDPIIPVRLSSALYKRLPGLQLSVWHFLLAMHVWKSSNRLNYLNLGNTSMFNNPAICSILRPRDSHAIINIQIISRLTDKENLHRGKNSTRLRHFPSLTFWPAPTNFVFPKKKLFSIPVSESL